MSANRIILALTLTLLLCTIINTQETGTVTDIDGNEYQTVKIGDQWWMAENLKVTRYRNGDAIPTGLSNTQWESTTSGAYAVYPHGGGETEDDVEGINSNEEIITAYGKLYNWYAVNDSRGLCPEGWHVPTDAEWTVLVDYVVAQGYPNEWDNPNGAGNALKSRRQVDSPLGAPWATSEHPRWNSHRRHHGLDVSGFSGLPSGYREDTGIFYNFGYSGTWWSSTEFVGGFVWQRTIYYELSHLIRSNGVKRDGRSVRCLRD
jgi:uncharacterized protein (TIGR02145 family)